uniref:Putative group iii salivary lipocalin n=1 Tax=Rhipicephalus pulchellus TaxID=72859 RepID=L7M9G3_RHIPC
MAASKALILWTLAVTSVAVHNPFAVVKLDLSKYQNPWPVINSTKNVLLARVSGPGTTYPCVRSRYWGYHNMNNTIERSFDILSTNASFSNISLSVRYENDTETNLTILEVSFNEATLVGEETDQSYCLDRFTFHVLYAEDQCLLLGNKASVRGFTNCSLWFPEKASGYQRPPSCCEFLFYVLCGQGSKVNSTQCPYEL